VQDNIRPLLQIAPTGEILIHDEPLAQINQRGYNRSTNSLKLMKAASDAEALLTFLNEYQDSPKTLLLYAKEIERLLLWCLHVHQISLSDLTREHIIEYQNFLLNPQPAKLWCGAKVSRLQKDGSINPAWKPFFKSLTDASIKKSFKVLGSFFNYLVEMHYLRGTPVTLNRRRKKSKRTQPRLVERYLEMDELNAVLDALESYPLQRPNDKFRVIRARYMILLLFYSGMRIAEAANHTMGHFIQRDGDWFLSIIGKGKKPRDIPAPDALLTALASFRNAIDLPSPEPTFKEQTPLIPSMNLKHTLQVRRIDEIIKWAFSLGAAAIESKSPHKASKLKQASAHWLRHSYVTYLLDNGASLKDAQENAGHSNVSTTMLYRHVSQTNRHAATRALSIQNEKIK